MQVFYPTDIRNALLAAEQATNAATDTAGDPDDPFLAGYIIGYRAALTTLALAFGLPATQQAGLATQPELPRRIPVSTGATPGGAARRTPILPPTCGACPEHSRRRD